MGCASSKQKDKKLCKNCQAPFTPVRRSYSMHTHQKERESFHLVALTSSTLGSFKLDLFDQKPCIKEDEDEEEDEVSPIQKKEEFVMGMVEAKTWSKMIDQKIPKIVPKTPTRTPPGEPETINAWELMEGLEDTSPLIFKPPLNQNRSFSFNSASENQHSFGNYPTTMAAVPEISGTLGTDLYPTPKVHDAVPDISGALGMAMYPTPKVHENGEESIKPLWLENGDDESNSTSNDTSIVSEFDPEVIATFRKALEELPETNPFHMKPIINHDGKDDQGFNKKDKLIVYFTSLRGVRKTYEDCCNVRVILKGLGVKIDERDVSMHSGFKDELKKLLGDGGITLPKVFIEKKYIGGAEEIRRMHEHGQLEKAVEGCELVDEGGGIGIVCEACGDVRFVPCDTCCGSCKIYYEGDYDDDDDDEEEESEESNCGFQPCPDCNENGLIRCPLCCD